MNKNVAALIHEANLSEFLSDDQKEMKKKLENLVTLAMEEAISHFDTSFICRPSYYEENDSQKNIPSIWSPGTFASLYQMDPVEDIRQKFNLN